MSGLMFVGAGPAGTGGGVKITTAGGIVFIILAEIRGRVNVTVLGKTLSPTVYRQTIAVLALSAILVSVATGILFALTRFALESVLFEAVSAFATVGLCTGITADIPVPGVRVIARRTGTGPWEFTGAGSAVSAQDRILVAGPPDRTDAFSQLT